MPLEPLLRCSPLCSTAPEATALLQSLNVELLASKREKETLARWFMSHRPVSNPQMAIERVLVD
jgi:hypothetical protein